MVVIRTGIKDFPEYCEQCKYYYIRVHENGRYSDICELSGERIDADGCKDGGWRYDGEKKPDNCPLMEVEDGTREEAKADSVRE